MIEAGRQSDGLFNFNDVLPTLLGVAGETERLPTDRLSPSRRIERTTGVCEPEMIREIDLNPVVVYPSGEGVLALDALMVVGA